MRAQSIHRIPGLFGALVFFGMLLALIAPDGIAQLQRTPLSTDELKGAPLSQIGPAGSVSSQATLPSSQGRFIVVLEDDVERPGAIAAEQTDELGGDLSLVFRTALKGYAAILPKSEVDELEDDPSVAYVTPDRRVKLMSLPTGVQRVGATANATVDLDEADDLRVDVDVAVIDTGVDPAHPDLDLVARTDCVPASVEETATCVDDLGVDRSGHGTHVAGTVGALDNGFGVVGVAPGARLWSVKALSDGGWGFQSWIIAGVDWVTAHADQIEVANMSLGCICAQPALEEAIEASAEAGVVYAVAAGNSAIEASKVSPAKNPDVITVSALADFDGKAGGEAGSSGCRTKYEAQFGAQGDDTLAKFSNFGAAVEVGAPGACILSTVPTEGSVASEKEGAEAYDAFNGTSMASPHVAGAAAILASEANPEDLEDVEAIRQTIVEEGNQSWEDGEREPVLDVSEDETFSAAERRATTRPATIVSTTKATLNGEVNPAGLATTYKFEYGTTTSYGTSTGAKSAGSGSAFTGASQPIEGLSAGVTYHFRVVATSAAGTFYGTDRTFATAPPSVDTEAATGVKSWSAELRADIDPEGAATTYHFQYGKTTSYGYDTSASPKNLPGVTSTLEGSQTIGALDPSTTYHYRVVAENMAGTTHGDDHTFTTTAAVWSARSAGAEKSALGDVACGTATDCVAVGAKLSVSPAAVSSKHLSGEEWKAVSFPTVTEEEPAYKEVQEETVEDVACSSASWCVATGRFRLKSGEHGFIYHWDGEEWSMDQSATEAIGMHPGIEMPSVSCISASKCFAVGYWRVPASTYTQISLEWDGKAWSAISIPSPAGSDWNWLSTVSCVSASSCIAFGGYLELTPLSGQGKYALWNGSEWTLGELEPSITFSGAGDDVACYDDGGAPACWTGIGGGGGPLHFDGVHWGTATPLADLMWSEVVDGELRGVSCASASSCVIVGWAALRNAPGKSRPIALSWDGEGWERQGVEPASPGAEWSEQKSELHGVACRAGSCASVGAYRIGNEFRPLTVYRMAPAVATVKETGVAETTATLNATIDPNGLSTTYQFEYGTTTAYGTKVPASPKSAGSGTSPVEVSEEISGLKVNTTYHFRVVATSDGGTSYGNDLEFTTGAEPPSFSFAFGAKGAGNGQFNYPFDIAIDSEGDVWVADSENHRVQQFKPNGEYLSKFGTKGTGNGQFDRPTGIAIDSQGDVWVADHYNNRVQQFSPNGEYLNKFGVKGSGNGQFSQPMGIAIDSEGDVWVTDTANNRVQQFKPNGEYLGQFGTKGAGNGQFTTPVGVALDQEGDVWVVDSANNRVQQFKPNGEYLGQFGTKGAGNGQFNAPTYLAIDSTDSLWVADFGNSRVQQFKPDGEYLNKFGTFGSGEGQLIGAMGIAIGSEENEETEEPEEGIWVSDAGGNRVQKWVFE